MQARSQCGNGEYISRMETDIADKECTRCSSCQPGFYLSTKAGLCDGTGTNDPVLQPGNQMCQPCGSCDQGSYINASMCDGTRTYPIDPRNAVHCIPCEKCPDLHVIKNVCSGSTYNDIRTCEMCDTSVCGPNTYIADDFCTGMVSAEKGFLLPSNCKKCNDCPSGSIQVGGCNGTDRNSVPECQVCSSICQRGYYVSRPCTAQDLSVGCSPCTARSPIGTYFVDQCSGTSTQQDIKYEYCSSCIPGQYINKTCPGGNWYTEDTHQCKDCRKSCSEGYYMSNPCTGMDTVDTVQCLQCSASCSPGQYMRAPCNGSTTAANTNDCQACSPCSKRQYISGGACKDGTAKNSLDRTCSACRQLNLLRACM